MPQSMTYKGNSVIYFRGDASKKIFILQSGRVIVKREDIETGQEVQEPIQTGEFFGVKSALGKFDRDEDAIVITDTNVVVFTVEEFEQLVQQNTRIGIKMLKVFSNQLRRIHSKVQSLLAVEERNPEDGLFANAEFYLKKKRYIEAIHILRRYLKHFPAGKYSDQAQGYLKSAEEYLAKYGSNNGPSIIQESGPSTKPSKGPAIVDTTDEEKIYYEALSKTSQGAYAEAIKEFEKLAQSSEDPEIKQKCLLEIGRAYFGLKEFDSCIKHIGTMLKEHPEHPEASEAMFLVGQSYEALKDKQKAGAVYTRLLSLGEKLPEDIKKKVKHAQNALGGA